MPIENIASVMQHGILSYNRASQLEHISVAMPEIQDKRDRKTVPSGLRLHQYANLYFHARNPMMFKRKAEAESICVLRINNTVSQLAGVVFSDGNAASDYSRFLAPSQCNLLDLDQIYALDWRDPIPALFFQRKSRKCAEILVPNRVDPSFIVGAHVVNNRARILLEQTGFQPPITLTPDLFFH